MSYQSAIELLPKEIMEQVQEYAEGLTIYIPRKEDKKSDGAKIQILNKL